MKKKRKKSKKGKLTVGSVGAVTYTASGTMTVDGINVIISDWISEPFTIPFIDDTEDNETLQAWKADLLKIIKNN